MPPVRMNVTILTVILVAATLLRFFNLGAKPFWIDEAITALITFARGPEAIPYELARPLSDLRAIFSMTPGSSWRDVVALLFNPAVQHTHPPLFYVIAHAWLAWWSPSFEALRWSLRAISAAFGVLSIAMIFGLARAAFGTRTGLIAAAIAAVSPGMIVVSQEARNYTLPMTLIAGAMWILVIQVKALAAGRRSSGGLWIVWAALNIGACYGHYYGTLAVAAQSITLAAFIAKYRSAGELVRLIAAGAVVAVAFLPWASTLLTHGGSPEQDGLRLDDGWFSAVHDTVDSWKQMVTGKGWTRAAPAVETITNVITVVAALWIAGIVAVVFVRRARERAWPASAVALLLSGGLSLLFLLAAALVYQKNLVSEVRYHFAYYPAFAALLGWGVAEMSPHASLTGWRIVWAPSTRIALAVLLILGVTTAIASDLGYAYPKRTRPDLVGQAVSATMTPPVLLVIGSGSFHETVVQLSFLLEILRRSGAPETAQFAFVSRANRYTSFGRSAPPSIFWTGFANVRDIASPPVTLWVNGVGRLLPYPPTLEVRARDGTRGSCTIDPNERTRPPSGGLWRSPYRLYHCTA
jgi:uncharacterized membrane protein